MLTLTIGPDKIVAVFNGITAMSGVPRMQNFASFVYDSKPAPPDGAPEDWFGQPFGSLLSRSFTTDTMNVQHQFVDYSMKFSRRDTNSFICHCKLLNRGSLPIHTPSIELPPINNVFNADRPSSQVNEWEGGKGGGLPNKFDHAWQRWESAIVNYLPKPTTPFTLSCALHQKFSYHNWYMQHEWIAFPTVGQRYPTVYQWREIRPGETWETEVWFRFSQDTHWQDGLSIQKDSLIKRYGKASANYPPLDPRPILFLMRADSARISVDDPQGNGNVFTRDPEASAWRNEMMGVVTGQNMGGVFVYGGCAYANEEWYPYNGVDIGRAARGIINTFRQAVEATGRPFGWIMRPEQAVAWDRDGRALINPEDPRFLDVIMRDWPPYGYIDTCGLGHRDLEVIGAARQKYGKNGVWFPEFFTDSMAFLTPAFFQVNAQAGEPATAADCQFYWVGPWTPGSQLDRIRYLTDGYWWGVLDAGNLDPNKRIQFAKDLGLAAAIHDDEIHMRKWPSAITLPPQSP